MIFNFEEQIKIGNIGEKRFLSKYPNFLKVGSGCEIVDFKHKINKTTVELKTDSYDVFDTPNMFMETISNDRKRTKGGPFRGEGIIDFYVYYFLKNDIAFWYETNELCNKLRKLREYINIGNATIEIKNNGYNTLGRKVNRLDIKDVCIKIEKFNNHISRFVDKDNYLKTYESILKIM